MMNKTACMLILLLACYGTGWAQSGIVSYGSSLQTEAYSWGQTLGRLDVGKLIGTEGIATPGIQQPDIVISTNTLHLEQVSIDVLVYPNPGAGTVVIEKTKHSSQEGWAIRLFDFTGRVLRNQLFNSDRMVLEFSQYPDGVYLLQVIYNTYNFQNISLIKQK